MKIRTLLPALAVLGALAAGAQPAGAGFPGANGAMLYAASGGIFVASADRSVLPTSLTKEIYDYATGNGSASDPTWSADGRLIAFAAIAKGRRDNDLWVMNADGSGKRQLTSSTADEQHPRFSPDGKQIVFAIKDATGVTNLALLKVAGGPATRLTKEKFGAGDPVWSPKGRTIAFASQRAGDAMRIWQIDVKTRKQSQITTGKQPAGASVGDPDWSPDGKRLVFASTAGGFTGLFVVNANGSGLRRLTPERFQAFAPAWSPDGQSIAYVPGYGTEGYFDVVSQAGGTPVHNQMLMVGSGTGALAWQPLPK